MKAKTTTEAADLLNQIEQMNVLMFADGDKIMIRPAGILTPELRQRVVDLKPELLRIAPRRRWRVTPPGRESFLVDCAVSPVTPDEIRGIWTGAIVEPP